MINKKALYESIMVSVAKEVKKALYEGKYGPTGKEAEMKLNSPECLNLQKILDDYSKIGGKEFSKVFGTSGHTIKLQFPLVWDGESRRLSRHLEYDDIFILLPCRREKIYYVINRDELFSFDVTYGGYGSGSYVSGESMSYDVNFFGHNLAMFYLSMIKELNPNTKIKLEDLEAD